MATNKIEVFVNKLTSEEMREAAAKLLDALPTDYAILVVQDWIKDNDLMDDIAIWCDENTNEPKEEGK